MRKKKRPTADELRMVLDYELETGVFTARVNTAMRKAGTKIKPYITSHGYALMSACGDQYYAHHLAWTHYHGAWPSGHVDHIDGDRTNNAILNLRVVDRQANNENVRAPKRGNKIGMLGVTFLNGKYRATITSNRKSIHLGMYPTPEQAYAAYVSAKRQLHRGCTL